MFGKEQVRQMTDEEKQKHIASIQVLIDKKLEELKKLELLEKDMIELCNIRDKDSQPFVITIKTKSYKEEWKYIQKGKFGPYNRYQYQIVEANEATIFNAEHCWTFSSQDVDYGAIRYTKIWGLSKDCDGIHKKYHQVNIFEYINKRKEDINNIELPKLKKEQNDFNLYFIPVYI